MATGLDARQIQELNQGGIPKTPDTMLGLIFGCFNHELKVLDDTWDDDNDLDIDLSAKDAQLFQKAVVAATADAGYAVNFTLPRKNCVFGLIVDADTNNINQTIDINAVDADGNAIDVKHAGGSFTSPNNNVHVYVFWWNGTEVIKLIQLTAIAAV